MPTRNGNPFHLRPNITMGINSIGLPRTPQATRPRIISPNIIQDQSNQPDPILIRTQRINPQEHISLPIIRDEIATLIATMRTLTTQMDVIRQKILHYQILNEDLAQIQQERRQ